MRPMNKTPERLKRKWRENPPLRCERWQEGNCEGRLTKEHVFTYAGKQIQEEWAIIDLCWRHHLGDLLDKRINEQIAKSRATDEDRKKYPRLKKIQL